MRWGLDRWVVLALTLSSLSGCFSSFDDASLAVDPASLPSMFLAPSLVDHARPSAEPALTFGPDGTVYVCAPRGAILRGTSVWRSTDNGTSFEFLGDELVSDALVLRSVSGDVGGGDCHVATDAGGRLYMADLWGGSVSVLSSADRGDSWRGVPVTVLPGPVDRPWIVGGDADEVFLTATSGGQGRGIDRFGLFLPPVGGIYVLHSTDGGLTFSHSLAASNDHRLGLNSNLAWDGTHLYLMYTKQLGEGQLAVMVASSSDRGATWSQHLVAEQEYYPGQCGGPIQLFPVIQADAAGGVYLAWTFQNPVTERIDLFFASSPDRGESWNTPILVADRLGTRLYPWMAVAAPGEVSIAWYDSNTTGLFAPAALPDGLLVCDDGAFADAVWYVQHARIHRATDPAPFIEEATVDASPVHTGGLGRPFSEFLQVATAPDGRVGVAYVSDADGDVRGLFALEASHLQVATDGAH